MGVVDATWWGVWWPWMLLWTCTVAAIAASASIVITHWWRYRKATAARGHGSAFYLNDHIMDLSHQLNRNHGITGRQDVEVTINKDQEAKIMARIAQSEAGGSHGMRREEHRRYTEEPPQPITVIGAVIDVLDAAGDIVNIELGEPAATPRRTIGKIAPGKNVDRRNTVRLGDIPNPSLVSVYGKFRLASPNDSAPTFLAPYGTRPATLKIHMSKSNARCKGCATLTRFPPAASALAASAMCRTGILGQGHLVLDPIAIFR